MGTAIVLGVATSMIAAVLIKLLAAPARKAQALIQNRSDVVIGPSIHEIRPADESDLLKLRTLYRDYFHGEAPSLDAMRAWLSRYQRALWLVKDRGRSRSETPPLVGSFKILPLTKRGVEALDREEVFGSTLAERHIAARGRGVVAYYVGDVVGIDLGARAAITSRLHEILAGELAQFPVYARPLTRDGRRVMRAAGFRCVSDGSEPEIPKMCRLEPRLSAPDPGTPRRRRRSKGQNENGPG